MLRKATIMKRTMVFSSV
jgi:hypothetical protein